LRLVIEARDDPKSPLKVDTPPAIGEKSRALVRITISGLASRDATVSMV